MQARIRFEKSYLQPQWADALEEAQRLTERKGILENALQRALVLGSTDSILPDDLPEAVLEAGSTAAAPADKYHGSIKETKKQLILQALQQANGNYIEAAKALGMHPNSLLRLVRTLDLKAVKAGLQAAE